jgi:membrane-bound serine protease (ClpP class)
MLGQPAEVLDWSGQEGHVLAVGERWQARALQALAPGERVRITGVKGLTLEVSRAPEMATGSGEQS